MDSQKIYSAVLERYSALSSEKAQISDAYSKSVAQAFGYTEEDLRSIPAQANLGLSCGNPLAIASLREGETVIDLGSGAGFDVFLASPKVGPTGRVIGVDMNKDMLSLAEKNKAEFSAHNVEFLRAQITDIPLESNVADAIISNCVINLVPEDEKQLAFNEIFRLLKPGGRVAVSDVLAKKPLPETLQKCAAAYVGCVAGASLLSQYHRYFQQAGFSDVLIEDTNNDLNVYIDASSEGTRQAKKAAGVDKQELHCCGADSTLSTSPEKSSCCGCRTTVTNMGENPDLYDMAAELGQIDLNEWVGSYKIFALKPSA
ncbi:S-adenosyl-L-methionine-dependent methyltransferase [Coniochaeta sp. 2T2.1]|nr:S-adenosyl-L-methionine-dependent methyltransferase [Coniochaeta sp. 2T2.1]